MSASESSTPVSKTMNAVPAIKSNIGNKQSVTEDANSDTPEKSVLPKVLAALFSYATITNLPDASHADDYVFIRELRRQMQTHNDSQSQKLPWIQRDSSANEDSLKQGNTPSQKELYLERCTQTCRLIDF